MNDDQNKFHLPTKRAVLRSAHEFCSTAVLNFFCFMILIFQIFFCECFSVSVHCAHGNNSHLSLSACSELRKWQREAGEPCSQSIQQLAKRNVPRGSNTADSFRSFTMSGMHAKSIDSAGYTTKVHRGKVEHTPNSALQAKFLSFAFSTRDQSKDSTEPAITSFSCRSSRLHRDWGNRVA